MKFTPAQACVCVRVLRVVRQRKSFGTQKKNVLGDDDVCLHVKSVPRHACTRFCHIKYTCIWVGTARRYRRSVAATFSDAPSEFTAIS